MEGSEFPECGQTIQRHQHRPLSSREDRTFYLLICYRRSSGHNRGVAGHFLIHVYHADIHQAGMICEEDIVTRWAGISIRRAGKFLGFDRGNKLILPVVYGEYARGLTSP